jgi:hypothetical protein
MDQELRPGELPLRKARQFSVRELLLLTLATSLVLAIGVSSRGSRYFNAFSSPWALAALVPIVVVLAIGRFQLTSRRTLAVASIVLYVASLCTPAISLEILNGPSVIWGWQALCVSAFALVDVPKLFVELFTFDQWYIVDLSGFSILLGSAANLAYVVAAVVLVVRIKNPRATSYSYRASIVGTLLVTAVLFLLAITGDLSAIYPGYGLWQASFVSLFFATRPLGSTR